jgi:hypothetical protein
MSFANLKRNKSNISKLIQAAESAGGGNEKKSYGDDRLWKPTVDKAGNGFAILRFLPAAEGAELPWVRYWDHGFKGPTGQWYIEKSLTSIGQQDPVSEHNSELWNTGIEANKDTVRRQKRRLHYVVNALVVSDPANPQNEGKVMLYQFGKKIFDKIMDVMQPQFQDEDPINPFDFWAGANFKLKIRQVEGYRNYDKSEFASGTALSQDDDELEGYYNSMHDLTEFTDAKNYKTYDELKTKLDRVLGNQTMTTAAAVSLDTAEPAPVMASMEATSPSETIAPTTAAEMSEDNDDTMSYFAKLAAEG